MNSNNNDDNCDVTDELDTAAEVIAQMLSLREDVNRLLAVQKPPKKKAKSSRADGGTGGGGGSKTVNDVHQIVVQIMDTLRLNGYLIVDIQKNDQVD